MHCTTEKSDSTKSPAYNRNKKEHRTENYGEWPFVPMELMNDLVSGERSLDDGYLQSSMLDWIESEDYNVFKNNETGEMIHALACKRGNIVYAARKSKQKKEILDVLDGKEFDISIDGFTKRRMTRMLLITVNFDRIQFTKEEAWAALRSRPIDDSCCKYNVINNLDANLTKIFGPHGKLVCKEAQESGYPAPHMILVLDQPVIVELFKGKNGESWRLCDPRTLRRVGKDPILRKMAFNDHRKAMSLNPIWKYGFIDIEGIVKGYRVKNKKDVISYPFKYLTKCLTGDTSSLIDSITTIDDVIDSGLKTTLYTHLGNKCFRTRDITFGKGFKERIGLLGSKPIVPNGTWTRIKTIPGFVHDLIVKRQTENAAMLFKRITGGDLQWDSSLP